MFSSFRQALRNLCQTFRKILGSQQNPQSHSPVRLSLTSSPYRLSISHCDCKCFCAYHCRCPPAGPLHPVKPGLWNARPDNGNEEARSGDRGMGHNTENGRENLNETSNLFLPLAVEDGSIHSGLEDAQSSLVYLTGSFQTHLSSCASLANQIQAHNKEFERIEKEIEDGAYLNTQSDSDDEREWDRCSTWSDVPSELKNAQKNHLETKFVKETNKNIDEADISVRTPTASRLLLTAPGSTNPMMSTRPTVPQLQRQSMQASLKASRGEFTRSQQRQVRKTCQKPRRRIRNQKIIGSRFYRLALLERRLETAFGTVLRRKPSTFSFESEATEKANAETKTRRKIDSDKRNIAPINFLDGEEVAGAKVDLYTSSPGFRFDFNGSAVDRFLDEASKNDPGNEMEILENNSASDADQLEFREDWFSEPIFQHNGESNDEDEFKIASTKYDQFNKESCIIDTAIALMMTTERARITHIKRRPPGK